MVFIADFGYPQLALVEKADAIATCDMFSNGTLPYERDHMNSLNAENLTYGPSAFTKVNRAPIMAWFGATLDNEKREHFSD